MSELGYMELIQAQVTLDQLHTSKICELFERIEALEEQVKQLKEENHE